MRPFPVKEYGLAVLQKSMWPNQYSIRIGHQKMPVLADLVAIQLEQLLIEPT
ncbi:hypothetical protein D3C72_2108670 [compost metagenome]